MPLGGALATAGGSILSSIFGKNSASSAANAQKQALLQGIGGINSATGNLSNTAAGAAQGVQQAAGQASTAVQQGAGSANNLLAGLSAQQQAQLAPYLQAGQQGATSLSAALQPGGSLTGTFAPPDPNQVASTPEYQFQLQQGLQALNRSAAATGGLQGGGQQKAIQQYSQGLASNAYQQAYNNSLSSFNANRQATLSSLGLATGLGTNALGQSNQLATSFGLPQGSNITNAAQYTGNATQNAGVYSGNAGIGAAQTGVNAAGQIANLYGQAGNAQAAGIIGQGNAFQNGIQGLTNAATGYFSGGGYSTAAPQTNGQINNPAYGGAGSPGDYMSNSGTMTPTQAGGGNLITQLFGNVG